jgi:hypothetical protein
VSNPGLEENKLYYFVMHHREDLLKFNDQMEDVAFRLASAECRFNPFRVLYSGYDPDVEEVDVSADRRRKQGYGPLVKETFAQQILMIFS